MFIKEINMNVYIRIYKYLYALSIFHSISKGLLPLIFLKIFFGSIFYLIFILFLTKEYFGPNFSLVTQLFFI